MSTLATYVWKEWRDQRATVFGILGVQLLTCVLLALFLQGTVFASTGMVTAMTFGSIALTLVVFGPELIAGENHSGTLGFLCRMPSGLQWAFWAKVVFLLGAMACLVCTGFAISSGFYIATGQDWDAFVPQTIFSSGMIPGAVTLGLLLMAVSCWLPRSILTISRTAELSAAKASTNLQTCC